MGSGQWSRWLHFPFYDLTHILLLAFAKLKSGIIISLYCFLYTVCASVCLRAEEIWNGDNFNRKCLIWLKNIINTLGLFLFRSGPVNNYLRLTFFIFELVTHLVSSNFSLFLCVTLLEDVFSGILLITWFCSENLCWAHGL